jgi:SAM-dependent methyltransferase
MSRDGVLWLPCETVDCLRDRMPLRTFRRTASMTLPERGVSLMAHEMRPLTPDNPAYAGQKHYTRSFLRIYDPLVLGLFGNLVWRCPTRRLVEHYNRHLSSRHLDVGPGTGYFLDRAAVPPSTQLALLDPNANVLAHAARRLARLAPSTVQADVLEPLPTEERFDSAALNYVVHCLPGPMEAKAPAIRNVAAVLDANGVLFGATVLGTPDVHTRLSRLALRDNNRRGIFDNLDDTEEGLRRILEASFADVQIEMVGSVAIFTASRPT